MPGLQTRLLRRQPFLGRTPWGRGSPASAAPLGLPALSPPLDIILPQWSQHNGCFHTLRDKGRRLRHDTAPFQAEAGILESLKINGKGKCEQ